MSGSGDLGTPVEATHAALRSTLPRRPRHVVLAAAARRKLDSWAPITLVIAIQGYGKTTAVAEWLRDQPGSVRTLWLNASGRDRDLDRALVARLDASGGSAATADPSGATGVALLDTAAASLAPYQRMVLVIDDAHAVQDDAFLRDLAEVVGRHERLHLVVCSRSGLPVAPLVGTVADAVKVRGSDLLLTEADIGELTASMGVELGPGHAAELHGWLGGWPAAVTQVLDQLTTADRVGGTLPLSRAEHYLREVVLPALGDQAALAKVMRLSLADRLTLALVRDLCDDDDREASVRHLESLGLIERRYERDDVVLAVPPFLRLALRRAYADAQPAQARLMHARLARWFLEHAGPGHVAHALHHAVAGRDDATVEQVWRRHSAELVFEHTAQVVEILATLTPEELAARPSMSITLDSGRALLGLDTDGSASTPIASAGDRRVAAMRAYASTSRRFAASGLDHLSLHEVLFVGTGAMVALRLDGRFADATAYGKLLEHRVASLLAAGDDPGDRLPWFHLQRGLTRTLQAHHAAAAHHYQLAWQLRRHASQHIAASAAASLALTHAVTGESQLAQFWLRSLERLGDLGSEVSIVDANAALARGLMALDQLDAAASAGELARFEVDLPLELWAYRACLAAQHGLHFADPAASLAVLDATPSGPYGRPHSEATAATLMLVRARADLLLAVGQGQRAHTALAPHDPERMPMLAVPLVRLSLLAGDPTEARRIAGELVWSETIDHRSRQELLLLKTVAARRMGDLATSRDLFHRTLGLYEHTGLLRPFATIDRADLDALLADAPDALDADALARIDAHPSPFPSALTLIRLTPRERDLMAALATTASRQQIADELYVSLNTVRTQLATLYRKLGVRTREEALAQQARFGLLPPREGRGADPDPRAVS